MSTALDELLEAFPNGWSSSPIPAVAGTPTAAVQLDSPAKPAALQNGDIPHSQGTPLQATSSSSPQLTESHLVERVRQLTLMLEAKENTISGLQAEKTESKPTAVNGSTHAAETDKGKSSQSPNGLSHSLSSIDAGVHRAPADDILDKLLQAQFPEAKEREKPVPGQGWYSYDMAPQKLGETPKKVIPSSQSASARRVSSVAASSPTQAARQQKDTTPNGHVSPTSQASPSRIASTSQISPSSSRTKSSPSFGTAPQRAEALRARGSPHRPDVHGISPSYSRDPYAGAVRGPSGLAPIGKPSIQINGIAKLTEEKRRLEKEKRRKEKEDMIQRAMAEAEESDDGWNDAVSYNARKGWRVPNIEHSVNGEGGPDINGEGDEVPQKDLPDMWTYKDVEAELKRDLKAFARPDDSIPKVPEYITGPGGWQPHSGPASNRYPTEPRRLGGTRMPRYKEREPEEDLVSESSHWVGETEARRSRYGNGREGYNAARGPTGSNATPLSHDGPQMSDLMRPLPNTSNEFSDPYRASWENQRRGVAGRFNKRNQGI